MFVNRLFTATCNITLECGRWDRLSAKKVGGLPLGALPGRFRYMRFARAPSLTVNLSSLGPPNVSLHRQRALPMKRRMIGRPENAAKAREKPAET